MTACFKLYADFHVICAVWFENLKALIFFGNYFWTIVIPYYKAVFVSLDSNILCEIFQAVFVPIFKFQNIM